MQIADEYRLSEYQDIGFLDEEKNIRLMRHRFSGKICVEKHVSPDAAPVYAFLAEHPNPHVPEIYEHISAENEVIVVEEYIDGETLESLRQEREIRPEEAVRIIESLCGALKPLHAAKPPVICRDLKAENIMLDGSGIVRIVDFDIARTYQPGKTRDTRLLGTKEYAAPEQFGYGQTDARTDIYALGVLLNYLILGKFPAEQRLDGALGEVVKKCTRMDPEQRFQSAEELRAALAAAQSGPAGQFCRACGAENPGNAVFCRNCGARLQDSGAGSMPEKKEEKIPAWRTFLPPGFRTGKVWKMILVAAAYFCFTCICFNKSILDFNGYWLEGRLLRIEQLLAWLFILFFIFLLFDYRGIRRKIPLLRNRKIAVRIAGYCLAAAALYFIYIVLCVALETKFL